MMNRVISWIKQNNLIQSGDTVICALSGGVDSIVMLDIINKLKDELNIKVCAAHFNHHIRGEESDRDMEFAREFCNKLGVEFYEGHGDVLKRAEETKESVEEAARYLRYEFLESINKDAKIATAHHSNDNLETMLIKLIRGCGQSGICGIPPRRGNIIRPLLCLSRDDIVEYANVNNLSHVEDSTNSCDDYLRNRIRHNIIPLLTAENVGVLSNALNAAQMIRADNEYLDSIANKEYDKANSSNGYDSTIIMGLDTPIKTRVVKRILADNGVEYNNKNIKCLIEIIDSNRTKIKLNFTNNKVVVVDKGYINIIDNRDKETEEYNFELDDNSITELPVASKFKVKAKYNETCTIISKSPYSLMISSNSISGKLHIRNRLNGDKITLPCGTKSIGRWLKEKGVPEIDRNKYSVICDDNGVVAVLGIGVSMKNRVNIGDATIRIEVQDV